MSPKGRDFERAAWNALDYFERMILEGEAGVQTGRLNHEGKQRAAASIQSVAKSTADLFNGEPGPAHLDEDRVRALGDKLRTLGERCTRVVHALGGS